MVLLDDERRHVEVNSAYLELLGYERSALIGQPITALRTEGPIASAREWRAALRQKQFTGVANLVRADGRQVTIEFAGHPEVVTGKQLVLFVALEVVTARRHSGNLRQSKTAPAALSSRELEVVGLISMGLSGPEIARELQVTHNTVRTHVRNAMGKLQARSRAQLVATWLGEAAYRRDEP